jgi:hypothetical protein
LCQAESLAIVPGTIARVSIVADSSTATGLAWAAPAGGSTFVGCLLKKNTNQSTSNGADGAISFQVEDVDTDGFFNSGTSTTVITIPSGKGGKYLLQWLITYADAGNVTGARAVSVRILTITSALIFGQSAAPVSGDQTRCNGSLVLNLSAADTIEIFHYQNSGGSLDIVGTGGGTSRFNLTYLGA